MSALKEEKYIAPDIKLVYDLAEKPNLTNLKAQTDRAAIANMRLDLVLPENNIMTVNIDFDTTSGYHGNTMMVMDDFGVEMLATAFAVKYGQEQADVVTKAWQQKQQQDDPRKPTYLLVQKPQFEGDMPKVFALCGTKKHEVDVAPDSIV